jgi:hypothetical protein
MPLYEYVCPDGETITLLRSVAQADDPVEDPKGRGRRFIRKQSAFNVGATASPPRLAPRGCPCGNPDGPCRMP